MPINAATLPPDVQINRRPMRCAGVGRRSDGTWRPCNHGPDVRHDPGTLYVRVNRNGVFGRCEDCEARTNAIRKEQSEQSYSDAPTVVMPERQEQRLRNAPPILATVYGTDRAVPHGMLTRVLDAPRDAAPVRVATPTAPVRVATPTAPVRTVTEVVEVPVRQHTRKVTRTREVRGDDPFMRAMKGGK